MEISSLFLHQDKKITSCKIWYQYFYVRIDPQSTIKPDCLNHWDTDRIKTGSQTELETLPKRSTRWTWL